MSMRVARVIPVEVHVEILLECEFVVPKELREVPVNEALDVVGTRLDAEQFIRWVLRHGGAPDQLREDPVVQAIVTEIFESRPL